MYMPAHNFNATKKYQIYNSIFKTRFIQPHKSRLHAAAYKNLFRLLYFLFIFLKNLILNFRINNSASSNKYNSN